MGTRRFYKKAPNLEWIGEPFGGNYFPDILEYFPDEPFHMIVEQNPNKTVVTTLHINGVPVRVGDWILTPANQEEHDRWCILPANEIDMFYVAVS